MVEVSAGIIVSNNRVLCFQKGMAKYPYLISKWEFPGGKVERGEQPKDTLMRELKEELKLDIRDKKIQFLCDTEHNYPDFKVIIHSFLIFYDDPIFELTEHKSTKWCTMEDIKLLDWADADKDIINYLEAHLDE